MTRKLLMLGSSNVTYRGQGASTSELLYEELTRSQPHGWEVRAAPITMGRRMVEAAEAEVRSQWPDVIVLSLNAQPSVYESVLVKVRRRWPRAADAAASIEGLLRKVAGASAGQEESGRGRIYSASHALALALIGGETRMTVEQSLANTRACLAMLAGLESMPVLVRLPVGGARARPARRARYEERLARLKAGIVAACDERRLPYVDVGAELQAAARSAGHGHDDVHLDLETRRFEARLLAARLLQLAPAV